MLFYVSLAVATFITSAVALWILRSLFEIGKTTYRAILPSSRQNRHPEPRLTKLSTNLEETPSPWGWSGAGGARHAVLHKQRRPQPVAAEESRAKVPWGWPGNEGLQRSNHQTIARGLGQSAAFDSMRGYFREDALTGDDQVGWPYREEKDKPARWRRASRKRVVRTIDGVELVKPWGW